MVWPIAPLNRSIPVVRSAFDNVTIFGQPYRGKVVDGILSINGVDHVVTEGTQGGVLLNGISRSSRPSRPGTSLLDNVEGFDFKNSLLLGTNGIPPGYRVRSRFVVGSAALSPLVIEMSTEYVDRGVRTVSFKVLRRFGVLGNSIPEDINLSIPTEYDPVTLDPKNYTHVINIKNDIEEYADDMIRGIDHVLATVSPTGDKIALITTVDYYPSYYPGDSIDRVRYYSRIAQIDVVSFSGSISEHPGVKSTILASPAKQWGFQQCMGLPMNTSSSGDATRKRILSHYSYESVHSPDRSGWTSSQLADYCNELADGAIGSLSNSIVTTSRTTLSLEPVGEGESDYTNTFQDYTYTTIASTCTVAIDAVFSDTGTLQIVHVGYELNYHSDGYRDVLGGSVYSVSSIYDSGFSIDSEPGEYFCFIGTRANSYNATCTYSASLRTSLNSTEDFFLKIGAATVSTLQRKEVMFSQESYDSTENISNESSESIGACSGGYTGSSRCDVIDTAPSYSTSGTQYGFDGNCQDISSSSYSRVITLNDEKVFEQVGENEGATPSIDKEYEPIWLISRGYRMYGIVPTIEGTKMDLGVHYTSTSLYGDHEYTVYDPYEKQIIGSDVPITFL